jgi:C-terminal processing protease CtpA/Prc
MNLRKLFLPAFALLLISTGAAMAQQTPAPEASTDFTFLVDGGSFLGVYTEEVTRENMGRFNLREPRGVAISKVVEGSPAEKAGLRKDDVVLRFNGEEVTGMRKLSRLINEVAPDHTARVTISRSGAEQELSVTLGKSKDFRARTFGFPQDKKALEELYGKQGTYALTLGASRRIGVSTNTLTKQLADYFGVGGGKGVLVTNVKDDSPAEKAGIKAGDVITQVDGEAIEDAGDLTRAINRKTEGDITLTITRDKSQRTIRVTPEKAQGTPLFGPGYQIEVAPRVGQITLPSINVGPILDKIKVDVDVPMPRIQIAPRIRSMLGNRPM